VNVNRNPQARQMADESMVRCLAAQAQAVWPQERLLIERYGLPPAARVLDVGCGTGEFARRVAALYPQASVLGVDLHEPHLALARASATRGGRIHYEVGDAYALAAADGSFDLVACRHLLQAVPHPEEIVRELVRVARQGGRLHLVIEDYGMMHFHPVAVDTDRFWREGPMTFATRTGTDLRVGRRGYTLLVDAGLTDVRVDYITVDTLRVPRETFAAIWTAWRDGYSDAIVERGNLSREEVAAAWEAMLGAIRDPAGYGVWQLPVVSGRIPRIRGDATLSR
jgi:SAM-dependent methyltransferase